MGVGCLLLPVAIFLFFGRNFGSSNWLLLGFLAICVGGHVLMMRGMHGQQGQRKNEDKHKKVDTNQHHH